MVCSLADSWGFTPLIAICHEQNAEHIMPAVAALLDRKIGKADVLLETKGSRTWRVDVCAEVSG